MDPLESFVTLGSRAIWGGDAAFGLDVKDRRQHVFVVGKSGSGKSTLLRNLIVQDIEAGAGVAVIDPHGDLALELLDQIPSHRADDLVYFDAADLDHPIALNLLAAVEPDRRHLVVSGIVGAFKSVWGSESWGPRLEFILANCLSALMECQNVTLLAVPRMLVDARFRDWVVRQVRDPVVKQFWAVEFEHWEPRFRSEAIAPVNNKIGQFLLSPALRHCVGQVKSKIDARFMMDDGRLLIANLSKGRLGADKANLLGAMLVTQFQLAAMSRADVPEHDRVDFSLVVDEWHNFATDGFASILSEARKHRLSLVLAGQFLAQTRQELRDAVFGNVGTLVSFRVGESDAQILAREFGNDFTLEHFTDLDNYEVCVKLLQEGKQRVPFVGTTHPPMGKDHHRREKHIARSREKYATPRRIVEDRIRRWMDARF